MKIFNKLLLLSVCLFLFLSCSQESNEIENAPNELSEKFTEYSLFNPNFQTTFEILEKNLHQGLFTIDLGITESSDYIFHIENGFFEDLFTPDFKLEEIYAEGKTREVEMPLTYLFRGTINGDPNNKAYIVIHENYYVSEFTFNGESYAIEPVGYMDGELESDEYIFYNTADEIHSASDMCSVEEIKLESFDDSGATYKASCQKIEVTYLGDYSLSVRFGGNYSNELSWMSDRLAGSNSMYWGETGYPVNLVYKQGYYYTFQNSLPATFSNSSTFNSEWRTVKNYSWFNEGDVNYLWTGMNVSGVLGKAYTSTMCSNQNSASGYGEGKRHTVAKSNRLMAHEIGHIVGANHDNGSNNWMNQYSSKWNNSLGSGAWGQFNSRLYGNGNGHSCLYWGTCVN